MNIKQIKQDFERLKSERGNWDQMFQVLGEYVSLNKQNFTSSPDEGEFLIDDVFDSTGVFAAQASASALMGFLWPGSAKQSIEIVPPDDADLEMTTALEKWYTSVTDKVIAAMDDPKAGLVAALDEMMLDQIIFGTSGVGVEKGGQSKLLFKAYGVKECYVDEGKDGKINKVYLHCELNMERYVRQYGVEKVSAKVRKAYEKDKLDGKVKVLIAIMERKEKVAEKGMLAMPWSVHHIEYDSNHLIKEEGFNEFPISFSRFRKLAYEKYGRSPAMNALPDIKEANILREAVILATEKALNMPIGIMNDGMLGGSIIDTSPRAVNVFNPKGAMGGGPPVFDIGKPPDINAALARLEKLEQVISQHFYIDRLIDMNNSQRMTFGEAQIRDAIRTSSLSALFGRQISELYTPLISRCVNMMFRAGEFGVVPGTEEEVELLKAGQEPQYVPEEIAKRLEEGKDIYNITYKTKAASAARAEEYISIIDVTGYATQAAQVDPSVANRTDLHEALKVMANIRGLPVGIIRQDDEVDAINQQQAQQQQQQQLVNAAVPVSEAAKNISEVEKNNQTG